MLNKNFCFSEILVFTLTTKLVNVIIIAHKTCQKGSLL